MLKLFLWLRYLRKRKIVFLSIIAVALSTALLIVVASLFTGFIAAFEKSAVDTLGDVVIVAPIRFSKCSVFVDLLEQTDKVSAAAATLSGQGLLHLGTRGDVRAVIIWGIDPERYAKVTSFEKSLLRKKSSPGGSSGLVDYPEETGRTVAGYVGIGVIAEPDEQTDEYPVDAIEKMVGETVVLTTGAVTKNDSSDSGGAAQIRRRTIKFTIADIVFTGVYDLDKSLVYLPRQRLQAILYPDDVGDFADRIQIRLKNGAQAEEALAEIKGLWQEFADKQLGWPSDIIRYTDIETAKQMYRDYVVELQKQMGVLLLIFGVVSFSVVVLIFCIFYMIVRLKQKDIAIIKSSGAASSSVACIFLGFGACVGVIGSALGAVLGCLITKNINTIEHLISIISGLKLWKSSVYMFAKIPNEVDWLLAVFIVLTAIAAAAIGALVPAIVAARTRPVEILRYE